jgi:uncharacterized protein
MNTVNRFHLRFFALALGLFITPLPLRAAPIQCTQAQSLDEHAICTNADLLKLDGRLAATYDHLKSGLQGDSLQLLRLGQRFWLRERANCSNPQRDGGSLRNCLLRTMSARLDYLAAVQEDRRVLLTQAAPYTFIDPGYLNRFAEQYSGREVRVFGTIHMYSCKYGAPDATRGSISQQGQTVEIRFKGLGPADLKFLCEQSPAAHWRGRVMPGRPISLYADELLGRPLH